MDSCIISLKPGLRAIPLEGSGEVVAQSWRRSWRVEDLVHVDAPQPSAAAGDEGSLKML